MLPICVRPEKVWPKLSSIKGIRANLVYIVSLKNTLNWKYLQSFVRFKSMEVISIYCVFLPMFSNLRLYERHQTSLSYQVLSMQICLVNHLR